MISEMPPRKSKKNFMEKDAEKDKDLIIKAHERYRNVKVKSKKAKEN